MENTSLWSHCDERTQWAMESLCSQLSEDSIEQNILSLNLLATNYDLLFLSMDDIKKYGLISEQYNGNGVLMRKKNESIQIYTMAESYIIKLLQQLGKTPVTKHLVKDNGDDAANLLASLNLDD